MADQTFDVYQTLSIDHVPAAAAGRPGESDCLSWTRQAQSQILSASFDLMALKFNRNAAPPFFQAVARDATSDRTEVGRANIC